MTVSDCMVLRWPSFYAWLMDPKRERWALASTLGLWGGIGVAIGSALNHNYGGHAPWLLVAVPLIVDTALGSYLGLRQRLRA